MKLVALIIVISTLFNQIKMNHSVSFENINGHFIHVKSRVSNFSGDTIDFHLPVWTPGSYLVREYSKDIYKIKTMFGKEEIPFEQIRKNVFRVIAKNAKEITIEYDVYGFTRSVRTNHFNSEHAFIVPAATFMYLPEMKNKQSEISLDLKLPKQFKKVASGLGYGNRSSFKTNDLDFFYDCPIEVGNFNESEFTVNNVKHRIAISEIGNYDLDKLSKDMKKIVESIINFMDGDIPYEHYTFLVALDKNIGGGLEHLNSTALQASFDMFKNPYRYNGFLGLVAHEYFHLWNVKRIRPVELGPFDYDNETYTRMLWLSEGFTDYLDTMFPFWAGYTNESNLLSSWESSINSILSYEGYKFESVSDASFNAWIRYYRAGELQIGRSTTISYYTYGALVGLLLDMKIIKESNGEKSIRDLFLALNKRYKSNPKNGIRFEEFQAIANQVAGRSVADVLSYVNSTQEIDFNANFKEFGLKLSLKESPAKANFNIRSNNGVITEMYLNSYLYSSGLSIEDELISIDNYRVKDDYNTVLDNFFKLGQEVTIRYNRNGRMQDLKIKLQDDRPKTYSLIKDEQATDEAKKRLELWLKSRNN